jgi:uncharacterized protein YicC (UPF0701 family)
MTYSRLAMTALLIVGAAHAHEWGTWDDLPDQLLVPRAGNLNPVDSLYDQLASSNGEMNDEVLSALETWLSELDVSFSDNDDLADLLDSLQGESDEEIQEAIDDWLEDQLDEMREEAEDELDDLRDELEDREDDAEDALDEIEDEYDDEIDEEDEYDEPDEPDEPESSS